jgi:hypothetical protein
MSGNELWDSLRDLRLGLAERIESIWGRVGREDCLQFVSTRVVRDVVRDSIKSHDEMLNPGRSRHCSLGEWYWEKKSETSTLLDMLQFHNMNDSALFDRVSSPLVVVKEMMELRSFALAPLR